MAPRQPVAALAPLQRSLHVAPGHCWCRQSLRLRSSFPVAHRPRVTCSLHVRPCLPVRPILLAKRQLLIGPSQPATASQSARRWWCVRPGLPARPLEPARTQDTRSRRLRRRHLKPPRRCRRPGAACRPVLPGSSAWSTPASAATRTRWYSACLLHRPSCGLCERG